MRCDWTKRVGAGIAVALLSLSVVALNAVPAAASAAPTGVASAAPTAELDIVNNLVTDSGGVLQPGDFIYQINGGPQTNFPTGGVVQLFLDSSQTYTITEVQEPGYTTQVQNCTNLTLSVSTPTVCTFTNDDIPPTTTTVATTSTTAFVPSSTTTIPGATQKTVHSSAADVNNCTSVLVPQLQPNGTTRITVTVASDAFPQPHRGDPITLSNTTLGVQIPAALLQLGVQANLIHDGDVIPADIALVIDGHNTTPTSHTLNVSTSATIHVKNGQALPLSATLPVPATKWTPTDKTATVFFVEKSMTIVARLTLPSIGLITVTFTCAPSHGPSFAALGANGAAVLPTTTTNTLGTTPTAPSAAAAAAAAAQLPRTGFDAWPWVGLGALCVALGLTATHGARRRRPQRLHE